MKCFESEIKKSSTNYIMLFSKRLGAIDALWGTITKHMVCTSAILCIPL